MIVLSAGVRNALIATSSTAALAGGVYLGAKAVTGDKPTFERAMLGVIGASAGVAGATLLQQSATRLLGTGSKAAFLGIAAATAAGAVGILAHYASH